MTEPNGGWEPPLPETLGGTTTDAGERDGTPPTIERLSRAAVRRRSRTGPSATAIAGVLVPILLILIGTVLIAIALDPGESPEPPEQPAAALEEDEAPVFETTPPPYTLPTVATVAPVPPPEPVPPPPPETAPPPATTAAPTPSITPAGPEQAALASAQAYLAAIAAGDLATANAYGSDAQTVEELQSDLPGIVAGRVILVQFGPPVGAVVPMRLLLVTQHDLEGVVDSALTCAHWDATPSAVIEIVQVEIARFPGPTVTDEQIAAAVAECAAMEL